MSGSTSPPWLSASNAMPAVIAPSPITATTLRCVALALRGDRHAERGRDRGRRMADAERVVLAFLALRERREAVLLLDRGDAVAAAGQDLVRIALVADVPDQAVARRVEQVVQRDGQLDHAQAGAEMAAGASPPIRSGRRAARRATAGSSSRERGAGRPACRCAPGAGSGRGRSSAYCWPSGRPGQGRCREQIRATAFGSRNPPDGAARRRIRGHIAVPVREPFRRFADVAARHARCPRIVTRCPVP